jgi:hypothetical protein
MSSIGPQRYSYSHPSIPKLTSTLIQPHDTLTQDRVQALEQVNTLARAAGLAVAGGFGGGSEDEGCVETGTQLLASASSGRQSLLRYDALVVCGAVVAGGGSGGRSLLTETAAMLGATTTMGVSGAGTAPMTAAAAAAGRLGGNGGRSMPERFADASTRRHAPRQQHPAYETTANDIGRRRPGQCDMPGVYAGSSQVRCASVCTPVRWQGLAGKGLLGRSLCRMRAHGWRMFPDSHSSAKGMMVCRDQRSVSTAAGFNGDIVCKAHRLCPLLL